MDTLLETDSLCIKVIAQAEDLLPIYATAGSAGADLKANLREPVTIAPHSARLIPTGLQFEIPKGYEVQIRPRSGLAAKSMISVLNTPGTIDSDYRGEIQIILVNHSDEEFLVTDRMRIAQMILAPVVQARFCLTTTLATSTRAAGGFGHTGT